MTLTLIPVPYDTEALRPRILHIGFGAFARAHPMVYLHHGLEKVGGDWGVVAARLNSGVEALTALDKADGRYHVAEADGEATCLREIGVLIKTLHPARDGATALPNLIASSDLSLILLTITEKGYCTSGGKLDLSNPGTQADLRGDAAPQTAIGVIVAGLAQRRAAGGDGLTILSCDNQPENGALTRAAVLGFAREIDSELAEWIEASGCFPSSMVDRIVPAMTDQGHALVSEGLGREDSNAILCEPFRQWVIEDSFVGAPPPFAEGGAMLVPDVRPFEEMKLRMLNGAHTMLAWVGQLMGYETVSDCMGDATLRRATRQLMLAEQAPTLTLPKGVDIAHYADDLLVRFKNTRLKHRLAQIAMDSSQKMPQRLFAPIAGNIDGDRDWSMEALAVAAWIVGLRNLDPIADPHQEALREAARGSDPVAAVLDLVGAGELDSGPIRAAHERITNHGMLHALEHSLEEMPA
jgi:fructuronate reductase